MGGFVVRGGGEEGARKERDAISYSNRHILTFVIILDTTQCNITAKRRALKRVHGHGPHQLLLLRLAAFPRRYVLMEEGKEGCGYGQVPIYLETLFLPSVVLY